jgi:hypothetical protein
MAGFEPAFSCFQGRQITKLSHIQMSNPIAIALFALFPYF